MSTATASWRQQAAERVRVPVWLNLYELSVLMNALASARSRRPDKDERSAARRVGKARDRRLRAVQRAGGGG